MHNTKFHIIFGKMTIAFTTALLLCSLTITIPNIRAAEINLLSQYSELAIGQEFSLEVWLNTQAERLNAYEGTISYDPTMLEVASISDAESIVSYWVEKPLVSNAGIRFAGITAGGYEGEQGFLMAVRFRATQEGEGVISISDPNILKHDGRGSSANVFVIDKQYSIDRDLEKVELVEAQDRTLPESFMPIVAKDPNVFSGQWFVSFATQDKGSGIDYYAVSEKRMTIRDFFRPHEWYRSESPYLLLDQELKSTILVKAVDLMGNERIETVKAQNRLLWFENDLFWSSSFLLLVFVGLIFYVLRRVVNSRQKRGRTD